MKNDFKDHPHLRIVLKEMCDRVEADFNNIHFDNSEWYHEYEWTEEESDDFKKWLINYLYKHTKARDELLTANIRNKKFIERQMSWFMLSYSWRFKQKEVLNGKERIK